MRTQKFVYQIFLFKEQRPLNEDYFNAACQCYWTSSLQLMFENLKVYLENVDFIEYWELHK